MDADCRPAPLDGAAIFQDALAYVAQVRNQFGKDSETFRAFLGILGTLREPPVDVDAATARIAALFKGHPELLDGFKNFLPPVQ